MGLTIKQLALSASLLAIGGGIGLIATQQPKQSTFSGITPFTATNVDLANPSKQPLGPAPNFIAAVAEKVGPAVVRITTSSQAKNADPESILNLFGEQF